MTTAGVMIVTVSGRQAAHKGDQPMHALYNSFSALRSERGSQSLEAVGVSVATALVALALILAMGSILAPGIGRTVQCAVATVLGGGGCGGQAANGGSGSGTGTIGNGGQNSSSSSADDTSWWQKAGDWLKGQLDDLGQMLSDPAVWVGLGAGLATILLIAAAPISVPAFAALALAGLVGAGAGTLFGNWEAGRPLTENLLRNGLIGGGGGALAGVLGTSLVAIVGGSLVLNSLTNVLNGQRWDKGLLASGLLALALFWGGNKLLPRAPVEEPLPGKPGVEEPVAGKPLPCVGLEAPRGRVRGLAKPLSAGCTITPQMEDKILYGERVPNANSPGGMSNEIRGGHSPQIKTDPNYAVEVLRNNPDGTTIVKYTTQFSDGNLARIKKSTLAPDSWSDQKIIEVTQQVGDLPPVDTRIRDGAQLHRQTVDGVMWEVITDASGQVIASYPTGGTPTAAGGW